jgi:hypothetical protein
MKNYARILVAIAFVFGLASAVKAESQDSVIVALPFDFVVGTKSLPAGTYEVRNSSDDKAGTLVISNRDNGTSMFVLPYVNESLLTGKPELSFQKVGDQYFLGTIQTAATVYRLHAPHASKNEIVVKANDVLPASGSRGSK